MFCALCLLEQFCYITRINKLSSRCLIRLCNPPNRCAQSSNAYRKIVAIFYVLGPLSAGTV
ncbi:unnamed protein product [Larinioides sclopetarius]|uniref:Uncharacterized protein n=1 Tax=Larinioides sclopetarius TaxID=280406 RepID=A0AAV2BVN6_9ARAC